VFFKISSLTNGQAGVLSINCQKLKTLLVQAWLYYFQYTAEEESGSWIDTAIAFESTIFSLLDSIKAGYVCFAEFTAKQQV
jgi:hypothetical protein